MNITIHVIPYKAMRYPTCGDWQFRNGDLYIQVAELGNEYEEACVGLHEIIEALLCRIRGIGGSIVDMFDGEFEAQRPAGSRVEPGNSLQAPYREAHQFSTEIEKLVHARFAWEQYDARVHQLSYVNGGN